VVASAVDPHITVEPATKFAPETVRVKGALAAAIVLGLNDEMVGPLTANVLAEDEAPLEFLTVTFTDPVGFSWVLVTAAVSDVALP